MAPDSCGWVGLRCVVGTADSEHRGRRGYRGDDRLRGLDREVAGRSVPEGPLVAPVNPDALTFTNVPIVPESGPKDRIVGAVARAGAAATVTTPAQTTTAGQPAGSRQGTIRGNGLYASSTEPGPVPGPGEPDFNRVEPYACDLRLHQPLVFR